MYEEGIRMNCKCGLIMDEFPERWECDFCGYKIAKLYSTMSPSEMQKIVQEMKEYHNKPQTI